MTCEGVGWEIFIRIVEMYLLMDLLKEKSHLIPQIASDLPYLLSFASTGSRVFDVVHNTFECGLIITFLPGTVSDELRAHAGKRSES